MRNNDERVAAVKRRIIEIEYKKKIRRNNFIAAASAVASFIIIIIMADFIAFSTGLGCMELFEIRDGDSFGNTTRTDPEFQHHCPH